MDKELESFVAASLTVGAALSALFRTHPDKPALERAFMQTFGAASVAGLSKLSDPDALKDAKRVYESLMASLRPPQD